MRYTIKNGSTGAEHVLFLDKAGEAKPENFHDAETGTELEVVDKARAQARKRDGALRRGDTPIGPSRAARARLGDPRFSLNATSAPLPANFRALSPNRCSSWSGSRRITSRLARRSSS
jgi:hypothetical protein